MPRARTSHDPEQASRSRAVEAAVRRFFALEGKDEEDARLLRRLAGRWRTTMRRLRPLGELTRGNLVEVLADGDLVFERMEAAIAGACRRVAMDTYILANDRVGRRIVGALTDAARRGVDVVLVYDALGSSELDDDFLDGLREAGAVVRAFNPIWRLRTRFPRLVRNHRKICVVDGERAFCGGMNIGEEYAGPRLGTSRFRDTHLDLRGPAAHGLERLVLEVLAEQAEEQRAPLAPSGPYEGGGLVQVLESDVRRKLRAIQKALRLTVDRAVERCYLTTPYFLPPLRLRRSLERAAARGVDVRVLTAGKSDVPIVRLASRHLYGRLLDRGVRIFELEGRMLHAKVVIVDGIYATVGSFNLDPWSWRRNLEVTVAILDRPVTRTLEEQFEADLAGSTEVRADAWGRRGGLVRLVSWLAYHLMRL